jgi:hypothetical protein
VEIGRTVEKYLKTKHKERNHKSSTSLNPCFIGGNWVGLLKNTLRPNTKKESQRAAHHSTLLHRWKLGRTVENTLRPNVRKESQKAAHHSIPAFIGGIGDC